MKALIYTLPVIVSIFVSEKTDFKEKVNELTVSSKRNAIKAIPLQMQSANSDYCIRNAVVFKHWQVDQILKGVLAGKAQVIQKHSVEYGICPYFLSAIIIHESANGTSRIAREKNNVAGITSRNNSNNYASFDSVDDCIAAAAKLLGGKVYEKCDTVSEIQKIYCPVGAKNDPNKLNRYWLDGVVGYMNKISGSQIPVKML